MASTLDLAKQEIHARLWSSVEKMIDKANEQGLDSSLVNMVVTATVGFDGEQDSVKVTQRFTFTNKGCAKKPSIAVGESLARKSAWRRLREPAV